MSGFKHPRYYHFSPPKEEVAQRTRPTIQSHFASLVPVHVGRDVFGRVYVDLCKDDYEHLVTRQPLKDENRCGCRVYVEDLFEHLVGKQGLVFVAVDYEDTTVCTTPKKSDGSP